MRSTIFLNEMRERVAELTFGEDWIRTLTDAECALLDKYPLIQRDIIRADGSTVRLNHIDRCPGYLASKIDRAYGRAIRLDAQWVTIDTWLQDHGLAVDPRQGAERKTFNAILRKARKESAPKERRRGPKAKIFQRLTAAMANDVSNKRLSVNDLEAMPDKELQERYKAKRERVRAARQSVVNERRKKLPTNTGKK